MRSIGFSFIEVLLNNIITNKASRKTMKNLNNNQFEINKTTMRDMTPYELNKVAGGVGENLASVISIVGPSIVISISIITEPDC
jgi:hypothetical protein